LKPIKFGRNITPRFNPSVEVEPELSAGEIGGIVKRGVLDNTVIGAVNNFIKEIQYDNKDEEGYNPYTDPQIPQNKKYLIPKLLHNSGSAEESTLKLAEWDQKQEDLKNPLFNSTSLMAEILLDPVGIMTMTPGLNAVFKGKKGISRITKGIAGEEVIKQLNDDDRSLQDAVYVIGGAFVINRVANKFSKYDKYDARAEGTTKQKLDEWNNASKTESGTSTNPYRRKNKIVDSEIKPTDKKVRFNDKVKNISNILSKEYDGLKVKITSALVKDYGTDIIVTKGGKQNLTKIRNFGVIYDKLTNTVKINIGQLKSGFPQGRKIYGFKTEDEWIEFKIRQVIESKKVKRAERGQVNKYILESMKEREKFVKEDSVVITDIEKKMQMDKNEIQFKNRFDKTIKDEEISYVKTGLGLERLGLSAFDFIINGPSRKAKEFLLNLSKSDIFMNYEKYAASPDSVEIIMNTLYKPHLVSVIENLENTYIRYVKEMTNKDIKIFKKGYLMLFTRTKVLPNGEQILSYNDFQTEVYKAVRNKGKILSGNTLTKKYIGEAAQNTSNFFKFYEQEIIDTKLFLIELLKKEDWLTSSITRFKNSKTKPKILDPKTNKEWTLKELEDALEMTLKSIKDTSKLIDGYVPQLYKRTNIERNFDSFKAIMMKRVLADMDPKEVDEILDSFKQYNPFRKPYENLEDATNFYKMKISPTSKFLKQRMLKIDDATLDELIAGDFIETNIETLSSFYYRSITPDIVMTKKYGDPGGYGWFGDIDELGYAPGLDQVAKEVTNLVNSKKITVSNGKKIIKRLEDMRDLRKGIYGLSDNPHGFWSTTFRNFKLFQTISQLTGASTLADLGRLVTIGGLQQNFGRIFEAFSNGLVKTYLIGKGIGKKIGQLNDLTLQFSRAQILSGNDVISSSFVGVEAKLQKLGALNFQYGNLQNAATTITKTYATLWGGDDLLIKISNVVAGKATDVERMFLNQKGISEADAFKIWDNYSKKGLGPGANKWEYNKMSIANSDTWDDATSAWKFNRALNEYVDELIITPGDGSAPLIANTEIGSVFFQYKKFSLDMSRKLLIKGLQRKDNKLIGDIAALTAFGMIVDQSRTEDYGRNYDKKTLTEKLIDGAERGGVFGIFGDVNRMIESLSDNELGLRPLLGQKKPYGTTLTSKAGSITPMGSTIGTVAQILYDWGRGRHTHHTARRIRKLVPLNNIWYLDSIFDKLEKGLY